MTPLPGLDSAFEPTQADVDWAWSAGYRVWAFYLAGPGALHNWSQAGIDRVRARGFYLVPVYVPVLNLSTDPRRDADAFAAALSRADVAGAGCLDTEYSMRRLPNVAAYEAAFGDRLAAHSVAPATYAGGFTLSSPPRHPAWWIGVAVRPGTANQSGQTRCPSGLLCDVDVFDSAFPMAGLRPPAPPPPLPPPNYSPWPVLTPGAPMPSVTITVPTDAHGDGWVALNGSDARVGHLVVPTAVMEDAQAEGSFPPADGGYWRHDARWQDRGGNPVVTVTNGPPGGQANVRVVTSSALGEPLSPEEAVAAFGPEGIVTHDNWQTFDPNPSGYGGGHHDGRNAPD